MPRHFMLAVALLTTIAIEAQTNATFTLQAENDSWFGSTDNGYTNGTRLLRTWRPDDKTRLGRIAALLCRNQPGSDCTRTVSAGLGQTMYTPTNLERADRAIGDRPYGGWLFGTVMFDATRPTANDHLELYAGIIGSHSQADRAQLFVHRHVTPDAPDPRGWDHQIGEWAAFLAAYERSVKVVSLRQKETEAEWLDVTPALGAAAGNVFLNGSATVTARIGYNLPARFLRPIRAVPFSIRSRARLDEMKKKAASAPSDWDAYLFASGTAVYVARNIFLDAEDTTYRIEREPNVREHRAGLSVRIRKVRVAYQRTWRSSEFSSVIGRRSRPADAQSYDMLLFSFGPDA